MASMSLQTFEVVLDWMYKASDPDGDAFLVFAARDLKNAALAQKSTRLQSAMHKALQVYSESQQRTVAHWRHTSTVARRELEAMAASLRAIPELTAADPATQLAELVRAYSMKVLVLERLLDALPERDDEAQRLYDEAAVELDEDDD